MLSGRPNNLRAGGYPEDNGDFDKSVFIPVMGTEASPNGPRNMKILGDQYRDHF